MLACFQTVSGAIGQFTLHAFLGSELALQPMNHDLKLVLWFC